MLSLYLNIIPVKHFISKTALFEWTVDDIACGVNSLILLLRSESPSGMCAKLRTVAASNNRDHAPRSLYYYLFAPHIYGCCSSHIFRSWWTMHSVQRQWRGCNTSFLIHLHDNANSEQFHSSVFLCSEFTSTVHLF